MKTLKGTEDFVLDNITQNDIYIYRHIYYEYVKPLLKLNINFTQEQIRRIVIPMVEDLGWTIERYEMFSSMDMMQRLAELNYNGSKPNIELQYNDGEKVLLDKLNPLLSVPRLRCPIRSEQLDEFHLN